MDTERLPYGTVRIDCECCQLPHLTRDRDGAIPRICDPCHQHRGERLETRAVRAESHEVMLRERLTTCRASEESARTGMALARERTAAALASRGVLADRLVEAAETGCSRNCPAQQLGRDPQVVDLARKHRLHEDTSWDHD